MSFAIELHTQKIRAIGFFLCSLVIALGLIVLVGWVLDIQTLKSIFVNTALAMCLCGIAMMLLFQKNIGEISYSVITLKSIEMGHDLGMKIIAEGVETAEQLAFLRLNQCDIVQGYFFSRPLPPPALLEWLRNYSAT